MANNHGVAGRRGRLRTVWRVDATS